MMVQELRDRYHSSGCIYKFTNRNQHKGWTWAAKHTAVTETEYPRQATGSQPALPSKEPETRHITGRHRLDYPGSAQWSPPLLALYSRLMAFSQSKTKSLIDGEWFWKQTFHETLLSSSEKTSKSLVIIESGILCGQCFSFVGVSQTGVTHTDHWKVLKELDKWGDGRAVTMVRDVEVAVWARVSCHACASWCFLFIFLLWLKNNPPT